MISQIIHKLNFGEKAPANWPICPGCNKPLDSFQNRYSVNNRFSVTIREIFGYCIKCGKSCQLEQVRQAHCGQVYENDLWQTIRFRFFISKPQAWQNVSDLPVPAVAVGPAREFDIYPLACCKSNRGGEGL
jgi:hypothetical protein